MVLNKTYIKLTNSHIECGFTVKRVRDMIRTYSQSQLLSRLCLLDRQTLFNNYQNHLTSNKCFGKTHKSYTNCVVIKSFPPFLH